MNKKITLENALKCVLSQARPIITESVRLSDASDRILAQDITSDSAIPPFDTSAMDGYACRTVDRDMSLKVIETIAAGSCPRQEILPGACAKIMTGAPMPSGADMVVMVENTKESDGIVAILKNSNSRNIRYKGEDIKQGEIVLLSGTRITPAVIATLASVGCDPVPVTRQPVVGVIATGNELIEPAVGPEFAKIRNSNGYQLCAQIHNAGCIAHSYGIAPDNSEIMGEILCRALNECDVVIISGGVSAGDYDLVPEVMIGEGIDLKFSGIAIKPGQPTIFGTGNDKCVFGLPGNPVSTYVIFELLVRPFLQALIGYCGVPFCVKASLGKTIRRKSADRMEFLPVILSPNGIARLVEYHGSGHIHAYCNANGMVCIPEGVVSVEENSEIDVRICDV